MKSNCIKLVFKKYYLNPDSNTIRDIDNIVWTDSTSNPIKIDRFIKLFNNINDDGYCCCPFGHYSISVINDSNVVREYFIDTITTKGKAMFYDDQYQTSHYIKLQDWNLFLKDK